MFRLALWFKPCVQRAFSCGGGSRGLRSYAWARRRINCHAPDECWRSVDGTAADRQPGRRVVLRLRRPVGMFQGDDGVLEEVRGVHAAGQDDLAVAVLGRDEGLVAAGLVDGGERRLGEGEPFDGRVLEAVAGAFEVPGLFVGSGHAERAGGLAEGGEEVGHGWCPSRRVTGCRGGL